MATATTATTTGYISVRTKEGTPKFRRGGQSFTRDPVLLREADLDEEALKEIRAEPLLEVEQLTEAEALKRGAVTDGRLPLEKAIGDYPAPGSGTSGITEPPEKKRGTTSEAPTARTSTAAARAAHAEDDDAAKRSRR
jgi:hypothetical protein